MVAGLCRSCVITQFLLLLGLYNVCGSPAKSVLRDALSAHKSKIVGRQQNESISSLLEGKGNEKEVLKKIRLEMIKQDILNKLQMKCRPPPMPFKVRLIPRPVYEGDIYSREKDISTEETGGITQIVVPAQTELPSTVCKKDRTCFSIRFSHRLCDNKIVNSARLRLFKLKAGIASPNQRISIFELSHTSNDARLVAQKNVAGPLYGWITIDMTKLIKGWVAKRTNDSSEHHYLQVRCDQCLSVFNFEAEQNSQERPYMVINIRDKDRLSRKRRSLDCRPDTVECCRKLFYVSFAEIGWDDWIIQPLGFDANYCEGSCVGYVSPPNAHRSIMQRISSDKNLKAEFSPCCVATEMRSLPLLYFDEEGFIFKRDIPNMTVDSCGCS